VEALVPEGDALSVFVVDSTGIRSARQGVRSVDARNDVVEILSGVAAGETVVTQRLWREDSARIGGAGGELFRHPQSPATLRLLLVALPAPPAYGWRCSSLCDLSELRFSRITCRRPGFDARRAPVVFSVTRPLEEAESIVPGVTPCRGRTRAGERDLDQFASGTNHDRPAAGAGTREPGQSRCPDLSIEVEQLIVKIR